MSTWTENPTPLQLAKLKEALSAANDGKTAYVLAMLDQGFDVDTHSGDGWTVLNMAVGASRIDTAMALIARGANLEIKAERRWAPLFAGSSKNSPKLCRALLEANADPHTTDDLGRTALHEAARKDDAELCQLLIDFGAVIDVKDQGGFTPMAHASEFRSTLAAYVLIANGANAQGFFVAGQDMSFFTRLQAAARMGLDKLVIKELDAIGSDPDLDKWVKDAMRQAKKKSQTQTEELIRVWSARNSAYLAISHLDSLKMTGASEYRSV